METTEDLQRRIESTEDLQSVVKTMKALAAVKIRQFQKAVASLADYSQTIEAGLQVVLQSRPGAPVGARKAPLRGLAAVVFGSDRGMCGQLNEQIVDYAIQRIQRLGIRREQRTILAVGRRAHRRLEAAGEHVEGVVAVPNSIWGIAPRLLDVLSRIEIWTTAGPYEHVFLFYSQQVSGASYRSAHTRLLPLDRDWLATLEARPWPGACLPAYTMERDKLFSALVRQYLHVSIFRAFSESLASENASRLASMQGAERNIREQLEELYTRFHQQRQMSITEELLDIVAGFEALGSG